MRILVTLGLALPILLLGWFVLAQMERSERMAAAKAKNDLRQQRIDAIRATPEYAALLNYGNERCPGQPDAVIWTCGVTLRLPPERYPVPERRLCSSPDAPEFVGSFPLPPVVSLDEDTRGETVIPSANAGIPTGTYFNGWNGTIAFDPDGRMVACDDEGAACRSLSLGGGTDLPKGYAQHPIPDTLQAEPPPPEEALYNGHSLALDAYLDLDGRRVAFRASGLRPEEAKCHFYALHPTLGFSLGYVMTCAERETWRDELRAVFADLDRRTISVVPASCDQPPDHARIRSRAHGKDIDAIQAMRDWAVARENQSTSRRPEPPRPADR